MDHDSSTASSVTIFADMHSGGGGPKLDFEYLCVNLPEAAAVTWFEKTYDRDPRNVTCPVCGPDYSIIELNNLKEAIESYPFACIVIL